MFTEGLFGLGGSVYPVAFSQGEAGCLTCIRSFFWRFEEPCNLPSVQYLAITDLLSWGGCCPVLAPLYEGCGYGKLAGSVSCWL